MLYPSVRVRLGSIFVIVKPLVGIFIDGSRWAWVLCCFSGEHVFRVCTGGCRRCPTVLVEFYGALQVANVQGIFVFIVV